MILVIGTVKFAPGGIARLADAARTMIAKTLQEDGCIRYTFAQDLTDPDVMVISEAWRDKPALMAHAATAHMAEWRTVCGEIGVVDRGLRLHDTDEGQPLG